MSNSKTVHAICVASGVGAAYADCSKGPLVLKNSPILADIAKHGVKLEWEKVLEPDLNVSPLETITQLNQALAHEVAAVLDKNQFFTVFGGDHSCAVGTWSGAFANVHKKGPLGLIWIDAHMDSHTPETSETGNIHGMPLAALLGHGDHRLTTIEVNAPKLRPEHVCLIGIRSYEAGEEELLKSLNVRVYFMDEVKQRGLKAIMKEAIERVSQGTAGYGITVDIDSIDPIEAPGTGVSEPDGLSSKELFEALCIAANDNRFVGTEIVEFDPCRDVDQKTEKLIPKLLAALTVGKLI